MSVKRKGEGNRPANWFQSSEFWVNGGEARLRAALDSGVGLRAAAISIGATYPATEAKARRLGIWPRRQKAATEPASASEWVLAGYGGEEDQRLSGGQEIAPREVLETDRQLTESEVTALKRAWEDSTRLVQPGEQKIESHPDLAKLPKLRELAKEAPWVPTSDNELTSTECWFCPICRTMTLLVEAEAGKCCVDPRREDCPVAVMASPIAERRFDEDQISSKPKRIRRPKPAKLISSETADAPVAAADVAADVAAEAAADQAAANSGARMILQAQLESLVAPKRAWDFPPPGGCLFPFGDVGRPGFKFCAEPVAGTGVPYCHEHIRRVYGRGVAREEVSDG